jgi:PAS domain S-box-containing protein
MSNPLEGLPTGRPLRVLFVEDSLEDVEICLHQLKQSGFVITSNVVDSADEFLERLRSSSYDLVLADYRLPVWTGLEALELLKKEKRDIPFILITGHLGDQMAVECIKRGAADYVLKDGLARLPVAIGGALREKALRRQRTRFVEQLRLLATAVRSRDEGVLIFEVHEQQIEPRLIFMNEAISRMTGYANAELIGKTLESIQDVGLNGVTVRRMQRELSEGQPTSGETIQHRKDGSEYHAEWQISPILDASAVTHYVAIHRDVTERKRLEDQLREKNTQLQEQNYRVQEASRMKTEFLANMSHELRTPLNCIMGFCEVLHDGKAGPINDMQKEFLKDVLASSSHLLELINNVLDLSKVETGNMQFRPEHIITEQWIPAVMDSVSALAAKKEIQLETAIDPAVSELVIDPSRLREVLYNYLSNALKFTGVGGRVMLRVGPEDQDTFRIEVEDTGIGIRNEDLALLFVEFQQLNAGTAKQYQGTGLGLALTKKLVEAQGGRVGVRSSLGEGSTFVAILPRRHAIAGEEN